MPHVIRTPEAQQDLVQIVRHIANDNPSASLRWIDGIEHTFELLSRYPLTGERFRRRRSGEVRRRTFGNYVIYYRPLIDGIEVYRVLHGSRDHEILMR